MKVSGIICEYNPFHNGHLYHINETRRNGATHIVAVMSGNFVQRGDVAIIDKLTRARLAIKSGIDLVIELPVQYSLASAEDFAKAGVWLLDCLSAVDELSFGSECGDVDRLISAMEATERVLKERRDVIYSIMENGCTYPRALTTVLSDTSQEAASIISESNNILAVEYIRGLRLFKSSITLFTVSLNGTAGHNSIKDISDGFSSSSASFIREKILFGGKIDLYSCTVPMWAKVLYNSLANGKIASLRHLERIILYRMRTITKASEIAQINGVGHGLEHRIYSARMSNSLKELFLNIKTKRYTMARIKRLILSLLIGIKREDMTHLPPYGRILALNERGREILAKTKGRTVIPYATSLARLAKQTTPFARRFAELECRASNIYSLALTKITSTVDDFKAKIMLDLIK